MHGYWLLLGMVTLGSFNTGVAWLVQSSAFPLWRLVGNEQFAQYHSVWEQSAWAVVILPGALAAVVSLLMVVFATPALPRWATWTGFAVQLVVQAVTVFWLSPLDRSTVAASGGLNATAYERLMLVNWVRVILFTAYAILAYWMLNRSLWPRTNITPERLVLLGASALGLFAVGNVWLVQLVCYRLWAHVGRAEAYGYHIAWWRSIWFILFVPAGLLFFGGLALLWLKQSGMERSTVWLGLVLQVATAIGTVAWWAPLMARLVSKVGIMLARDYSLLMNTHWIRVALITAYGVTYFYILTKSAQAMKCGGS